MKFFRRTAALAVVTAGLGTAAFLAAGGAAAHVTVSSADAVQGGDAVISFQVPTESDTASTVELKVQLPADQPLADVAVAPHAGWSFTVTKAKLATPISSDDGDVTEAVSVIDWKADSTADGIKPGEFDQFLVNVGPLPKASSMTFKAIQTYSDKSVVSWIEEPAPGSSAEPDHPAPTLTLAAASATSATTAPSATVVEATSAKSSDGKATTALVLGIVGVLLGAGALAAAVLRGKPRAD